MSVSSLYLVVYLYCEPYIIATCGLQCVLSMLLLLEKLANLVWSSQ